MPRDTWKTRYGLILAAAGNAVGIGNLLRFPGQAANNGGGAFILPYLVSLVVLGLPMMWVAWTIGRYGGRFGHGSTPGMFDKLTRWRGAKYVGVLGVAIPLVFCFYYTYLEAWCLGYAWFSFAGRYETAHLPTFLGEFQGVLSSGNYFSSANTAFLFLVVCIGLNVWVLYRGVGAGIELLAKIAMPLLFVFCLLLTVRIFTLPDAKGSVADGLAFLWNPDFSALGNPSVWLAAAGQVFFTLSIGFGALECFASYVAQEDDIAVTGLTTASTNEFVEVIFGSMIAIPAAAVFFGAAAIPQIASSGMFDIGMISMPEILRQTDSATIFGSIWFLLLFFAAFTSSVAVCQPVMAFFQDELKLARGAAAALVGLLWLFGSVPVVYFLRYGFLDELDFWAGTLGLVLFSAIEVVLFAWVFGINKGWAELHRGALMKVPTVFRFMIRYVTPLALAAILAAWVYGDVIRGGKLTPKPSLISSVLDRNQLPGDLESSPPEEGAGAERYAALRGRLLSAVDSQGRDLKAWATVELSEPGQARVITLEGDPAFLRALPATELEEILYLERLHYTEADKPRSKRVKIVYEGLYTAPYIWLARGLILGIIALFLALIAVTWRGRAVRDENDGRRGSSSDERASEGAA